MARFPGSLCGMVCFGAKTGWIEIRRSGSTKMPAVGNLAGTICICRPVALRSAQTRLRQTKGHNGGDVFGRYETDNSWHNPSLVSSMISTIPRIQTSGSTTVFSSPNEWRHRARRARARRKLIEKTRLASIPLQNWQTLPKFNFSTNLPLG